MSTSRPLANPVATAPHLRHIPLQPGDSYHTVKRSDGRKVTVFIPGKPASNDN